MTPLHEPVNPVGGDLPLFLQEPEQFRSKQLFKRLEIDIPHHMKSAGIQKKTVCDQCMEVWMPLGGIGSEGVDGHHGTRHPFLHPDLLLQKDQQTFVGTAAETAREGAVIPEIDPQQPGDTEYIMSVGNREQHILAFGQYAKPLHLGRSEEVSDCVGALKHLTGSFPCHFKQ